MAVAKKSGESGQLGKVIRLFFIISLFLDSIRGLRDFGIESSYRNRPLVTLKLAFDQQGAVDDRSGKSERFTSSESLDLVHRLRSVSDAVCVGVNTVMRDNPSLTVRRGVPLRHSNGLNKLLQPIRIVYDSKYKCRDKLVMQDEHRTIVFTSKNMQGEFIPESLSSLKYLRPLNSTSGQYNDQLIHNKRTQLLSEDVNKVSDDRILESLHILHSEFDVKHLMVEGGPTLAKEFLRVGCVDRAIMIKSPVTFQQPVPSGINQDLLLKSELERIGKSYKLGGDEITCWKRKDVDWPTQEVSEWP